MPARLVQVTIINNSKYPVVWQDDGRESSSAWQKPWYPSNLTNLQPGQHGTFRLESDGVAVGCKGWAKFKIDVPLSSNVGDRAEFFTLSFERAYIELESFKPDIDRPRSHEGPVLAWVYDLGSGDLANIDSSPFEFIAAIPGAPLSAPLFLINDSIAKHVAWFVEVRNVESSTVLQEPLRVATKGIVYGVTARVEATASAHTVPGSTVAAGIATASEHVAGGRTPASGGDLLWFRHDGRLDGAFKWEGPEKVGTRWDAFTHVFSNGEGIVYGVTPRVDATASDHVGGTRTPASGGDLMWYRHVGREDGSFRWEGPRRVGTRWDGFKHVFCGGDGVVYGIQNNGDLIWYRHVGRGDGSFVWQGPKKVGVGWGELLQVFSDGAGIIYAVTPREAATAHASGGSTPASGGDLLWFRHVGWEDGSFDWNGPKKVGTRWDAFKQLFPGGDGVIYGVTPRVEGAVSEHVVGGSMQAAGIGTASGHVAVGWTPASGGDLMWHRHVGREDGRFQWEGPKKVGTGWGTLAQAFSGGVLMT